MRYARWFAIPVTLIIIVVGCSVLKQEDSASDVTTFLTKFQTDLTTKTDDEILANFQVKQSREAILSVIQVLQNKDQFIVCQANFAGASIGENAIPIADIPVQFSVKDLTSKDAESFTLTLTITNYDDVYKITEINGEEFYQAFQRIKNRNQWEAEQKIALQERLWIYEKARELEEKFDSVIWYVETNGEKYFYVVNGPWTNHFMNYETRGQKNSGVQMGLINDKGEMVIPIEYDLIGTIGFKSYKVVEVTKEGKHGYFDIREGKIVIEPVYDYIIPFGETLIVKRDTLIGWLDAGYKFTSGFKSSKMQTYFNNFEFLKESVQLKATNYAFCEIPNVDNAGNGIIIPPSYFSYFGIFDEIEAGISTTKVPVNGWTDYKESDGSFMEEIAYNLKAVVTTIRERYLEGREEFYESNRLIFVDGNQRLIGSAVVSGSEVSMHTVDSTLIEVRTPHDYWFMEIAECSESNLLAHSYFSISAEGMVEELKSTRHFAQTQFVKLDSSYLTGEFLVYNSESQKEEATNFLSEETITYMRDEILAAYGYGFADTERDQRFSHLRKDEDSRETSLEVVESRMTEVDKFNLAFLNQILDLMKNNTPA